MRIFIGHLNEIESDLVTISSCIVRNEIAVILISVGSSAMCIFLIPGSWQVKRGQVMSVPVQSQFSSSTYNCDWENLNHKIVQRKHFMIYTYKIVFS
jgi:hypothetical protein